MQLRQTYFRHLLLGCIDAKTMQTTLIISYCKLRFSKSDLVATEEILAKITLHETSQRRFPSFTLGFIEAKQCQPYLSFIPCPGPGQCFLKMIAKHKEYDATSLVQLASY